MVPISDKLSGMLNAQVGREIGNSHLYRQMSSWAHVRGLKNIASFFNGEADGEMGHAKLISDFLSDANVQIVIPDIPAKPTEYKDCLEIANLYMEAEAQTTEFLEGIYQEAESSNAVGVSNLLQGLLQEQLEEEGNSDRVFSLVNESNGNLLLLDLMFEK